MENTSISDSWEQGDPYERYIGRWSRLAAARFVSWLGAEHSLCWLDIGCGTGALTAAALERGSPLRVVGVEPSAGFLASAKKNLAGRAMLLQGTATAVPLASASMDVVVSGLVLNFIPDPGTALAEMARVVRSDGLVGAYVWDYAGKMELIRRFWDAASELDPAAASLDEGSRFPICNPDALAELFTRAGLTGVQVVAVDVPTPFAHFEDYWQPFLGGQGPAPAYVMALEPGARDRLRDRLRARLRARLPAKPDGSIGLTARAWAARGRVVR